MDNLAVTNENTLKNTTDYEINRLDNIFCIFAVLASVITSVWGLFSGFRFGYTLSSVVMLITFTLYLYRNLKKINFFTATCFILSLGLSGIFSITTNSSVKFFGFVVLLALMLAWFTASVSELDKSGDLSLFSILLKPLFSGGFGKMPKVVRLFATKNIKNGKRVKMVVLGFVISIPFLAVIIPLLVSSDKAFSGMVSLLFKNWFFTAFKILFGLFISIFVVSYGITLKKENKTESTQTSKKQLDNALVITFLFTISVCYLAYLFSQLAYFFSAFKGFLPENYNFTFSDYARRGFFEMSVIAFINFVIMFTAIIVVKKKDGRLNLWVKILSTFIGVFTLLIITTALSKMVLYVGEYGLTKLRVTTSFFMIFLGIVFIALIFRVFSPKIRVLRVALISASVVLIVLGAGNVNGQIARYNYNAYKNQTLKEIDVDTITQLGPEGVPYLIKLHNSKNSDVKKAAEDGILEQVLKLYKTKSVHKDGILEYKIINKKYEGIGSYNFSISKAYSQLDSFLKKNPYFLKRYNYTNDYSYNNDYDNNYENNYDYNYDYEYEYF